MLTTLRLENYRGFQQYEIDNLARVNLLVGRNNSGKTAVLEAIHILRAGGNPGVLAEIAMRRDEVTSREPEDAAQLRRFTVSSGRSASVSPTFLHFFHGHAMKRGIDISLSMNDELINIGVNNKLVEQLVFDDGHFPHEPTPLNYISVINTSASAKYAYLFPVTDEGVIAGEITVESGNNGSKSIKEYDLRKPVTNSPVFIQSESLSMHNLSTLWDTVIREGYESEVITALRILESKLTGIYFLPGGGRVGQYAGILIELDNKKTERVPLGSFGDGMRRMLALATAMVQCKDGVLLIDEVDTGLHYSVMRDLWRFLVTAARQFNVQVFTTTHSLDCLRGLAEMSACEPELRPDVSVQRIDPRLEKAVSFNAEEIATAVQQELEVR